MIDMVGTYGLIREVIGIDIIIFNDNIILVTDYICPCDKWLDVSISGFVVFGLKLLQSSLPVQNKLSC